jgi:hypothetical protein
LVCFMQIILSLPKRVRFQPDSPRQRPHNLHETHQLPRVQLITPDDGHRRCPKHVEFRDKIKILDSWCILLVIYTKKILAHVSFTEDFNLHFPIPLYLRPFCISFSKFYPHLLLSLLTFGFPVKTDFMMHVSSTYTRCLNNLCILTLISLTKLFELQPS